MSTSASLVVDGLSVRLGETLVLRDCSFRVRHGGLCGVLGANGSGKTTLMKAVAGLLPFSGSVSNLTGRPLRTAFATQGSGSHDRRTVGRHLKVLRLSGLVCPERLARLVEELELTDLLDSVPSHLSLGQRQAVNLLGPMAAPADLLVLDEPFVGLDVDRCRTLTRLVTQARNLGTTVLVSSHDPSWLENSLTDVVYLDRGATTFAGPCVDLASQLGSRYVELVVDDSAGMAAQLRAQGYEADVAQRHGEEVVVVRSGEVDAVVAVADAYGILVVRLALLRTSLQDAVGHLAVQPQTPADVRS